MVILPLITLSHALDSDCSISVGSMDPSAEGRLFGKRLFVFPQTGCAACMCMVWKEGEEESKHDPDCGFSCASVS